MPKFIEVDKTQFEKLCEIQCTQIEIAGWFRCSIDTIERWCKRTYKQSYAEIFEEKRQVGRISLRRVQFQEALKGNTALLIWLGKQYLGQSDVEKSEIKQIHKDIATIHEKIDILKLVKNDECA